MEIYLVGGAVRDKHLGLPVKDRDWVVIGATPEAMLARGFKRVGRDFPVFLDPATGEEYALARTERKTGRGYTGFEVFTSPDVTLEEDLRRRDLTINAMAETPEGTLVDPYNGLSDLEARRLCHVSPAFTEDPLRVLRVARFAARFEPMGFKVAAETMELMREMAAGGELNALVSERVWQEIQRALAEPSPHVFLSVLRECGALGYILPEVDNLFGVPQPEQYHPEIDTGIHAIMSLRQAARLSDDPVVRFAAMVHDVGKGVTPSNRWPSHRGHEDKGVALIDGLCRRLKVPNQYRELARLVSRYHTHCHRAMVMRPVKILETLENLDAFRRPERFEQFILACEADARGRTGLEDRPYPQRERLLEALRVCGDITARSVMNEADSGKEIGEKLQQKRLQALCREMEKDA